MSLFPAYSDVKETDEKDVSLKNRDTSWLRNTSYEKTFVRSASSLLETQICKQPKYETEDEQYCTNKKKKKEKKKHRKEKKKRKRSPLNESPKKSVQNEDESSSKKVFIEDFSHPLAPEHAFRIDRKSDVANFTYKSLYKLNIAKYYSVFHNSLGQLNVIVPEKSKHSRKRKDSSLERYFNVKRKRLSEDEDLEDVILDFCQNSNEKKRIYFGSHSRMDQEFIPCDELETKASHGLLRSIANPLGIYDASTSLFSQGKCVPNIVDTSRIQLMDSQKQSYQSVITRRTAEFNSYLDKNPHDVKKWLEFVDFQSQIIRVRGDQKNPEKEFKTELVLKDIKLSVMEKAIKINSSSVELKLAQLELARDVWDKGRTKKEWKQLTFRYPNDPDIWQLYLEYLNTNFTSFTVTSIIKAYEKCLETLQNFIKGNVKSHPLLPNTQERMFGIFLDLCHILWQAGHQEKTIAMFQALIEFNVFCPEVLCSAPMEEKLDFFEAFWDSSVPRFGEDYAKGFNTWIDSKADVPFSSMFNNELTETKEEDIIKGSGSCKSETWVDMEESRSANHWLPWRPYVQNGESEEDVEDAERLVMFDDLKAFIFPIEDIQGKQFLLFSFLKLLGVECNVFTNTPCHHSKVGYINLQSNENLKRLGVKWNKGCKPISLDPGLLKRVIENIFSQLRPHFSPTDQTAFNIAELQWKLKDHLNQDFSDRNIRKASLKDLKKAAKSMLQVEENRNNLVLWEQYAIMEWRLQNKNDAIKVICTALKMTANDTSLNAEQSIRLYSLYRTMIELLFGIHDLDFTVKKNLDVTPDENRNVLNCIMSLATRDINRLSNLNEPLSSVQHLKCQRNLQQHLDEMLLLLAQSNRPQDSLLRQLLHWTICDAIFLYITFGIGQAEHVFHKVIINVKKLEEYPPVISFLEELTVKQNKLMKYHLDHSVSPLEMLRAPLKDALNRYPDNPELLLMLFEVESHGNVAGRLLRQVGNLVKQGKTPLPWILSALTELLRIEDQHKALEDLGVPYINGISYQLRSWFEKAVHCPSSRHCPLLWRLYFYFEINQNQMVYAKGLFYRAIQHCPWSKDIYMDYIKAFPNHLQEATDLIIEKELRLRTPLEEIELLLQNKDADIISEEISPKNSLSSEALEDVQVQDRLTHIESSQNVIVDSLHKLNNHECT